MSNNHSPSHSVYTIRETGPNRKNFWVRIGGAWTNKDGSLNVILDALPLNGTLHIRVPNEKESTS